MATKAFQARGLLFATNNYAAPLHTEKVPEAFHLMQNFLRDSEIGRALINPLKLSAAQIASFWQTAIYDDGGKNGTPSIIFSFEDSDYAVTLTTVRTALDLETHNSYSVASEQTLRTMLQEMGYSASLAKLGSVKRPNLRKEWSFFFDCITRAFGNKVTNWDAVPLDSLQIGYSLLYGSNYDFARLVLSNIGERVKKDKTTVYFARFCQLLFNACIPNAIISDEDVIQPFKVDKRIYADLTKKDVTRDPMPEMVFPLALQNFLHQPQDPHPHSPVNTEPQQPPLAPASQPLNSAPQSPTQPKKKGGGRIKKKRAQRPPLHSVEEDVAAKRRRLLIDESEDEMQLEEVISKITQAIEPNSDKSTQVHEDHRVGDEAVHAAVEPLFPISDAVEPVPPISDVFEALSAYSGETDVAEQATVVLEEPVATHTDIISDAHQEVKQGDEVDQLFSEHAEDIVDKTAEIVKVVTEEIVDKTAESVAEILVEKAAESTEKIIAEKVTETVEVVVSSSPVAATVNAGNTVPLVNAIVQEVVHDTATENADVEDENEGSNESDFSDHAPVQTEGKHTSFEKPSEQHDREREYLAMLSENWYKGDCIFSTGRAEAFVQKTARKIKSPDVLASLKANIVQVKTLNLRFDDVDKKIVDLGTDVGKVALNYEIQHKLLFKRLGQVEDNQKALSGKIDAIATSLELITSALIPDDVKKGERVTKGRCKKTQTLTKKDDTTGDGGAKDHAKTNLLKLKSIGSSSGAQSTSKVQSLPISDNPTTDEELAAKLFLEENNEGVTIEDIQAEEADLKKKHEQDLKSGKLKVYVKSPRKPAKGIQIKENVGTEQKSSLKPTEIDRRKLKGKMVEEENAEKKKDTTSVTTHVVQPPAKTTTSVDTQVAKSSLQSQMQLNFVKPTMPDQTLKTDETDPFQGKVLYGKLGRDKTGLGSNREVKENTDPRDPSSLAVPGKGVTQENLDKLESVQLIHQRSLNKDFLLYFMADGTVYKIAEDDINLKLWEELEYVLYLFRVKNSRTQQAANVLRRQMWKARAIRGTKSTGEYVPKYRDYQGNIVEMKKNGAELRTNLGITVLEFSQESEKPQFIRLGNDMKKNKIYSLRSAIYQTDESDPKLKEIKKAMQTELENAERRLLIDYLRTTPDVEEIK